jgi:hypothetical protein
MQSNWISYEILFKVSTTYAHSSYLLLIASDILLRNQYDIFVARGIDVLGS